MESLWSHQSHFPPGLFFILFLFFGGGFGSIRTQRICQLTQCAVCRLSRIGVFRSKYFHAYAGLPLIVRAMMSLLHRHRIYYPKATTFYFGAADGTTTECRKQPVHSPPMVRA